VIENDSPNKLRKVVWIAAFIGALAGSIVSSAVLLGFLRPTQSPQSASLSKNVARASGAVVTVRALHDIDIGGFQERIGCGVIYSSDGYIITNEHLVAMAKKVDVKIGENKEMVAKVIGTNKEKDLAVLKVDSRLKAAELGESSSVSVGDEVVVIGKPFTYSSEYTVTKGVVSAIPKNTPKGFPELLQTDATINPGNSGGPLCDTKGRVIGITTAYLSTGESAQGIGFAIPIDIVKQTFEELTKGKR
jgi:serine protease Do